MWIQIRCRNKSRRAAPGATSGRPPARVPAPTHASSRGFCGRNLATTLILSPPALFAVSAIVAGGARGLGSLFGGGSENRSLGSLEID